MSDIKLFQIANHTATEIHGTTSPLEKALQVFIEANLESLLGIRFLASEYSTGKTHGGRIDTLGIDENQCPVIVEYKRTSSENVINQGLYYLDWLMDHQAEFKLLVLDRFGKGTADSIDWSAPRLLCIAADFTKFDSHAVQQINRNIELIRYRRFGDDLLLFELVNAVSESTSSTLEYPVSSLPKKEGKHKLVVEWLKDLPKALEPVFNELDTFVFSLGDDVQRKDMKLYIAYKRIRNFVTIVFQQKRIILYLHLNPQWISDSNGFLRDVSKGGHWGTGNAEIGIATLADLHKAKPYIEAAYEGR
ncbi:MAG: DUF5655 domain-containing protein [Opitutales bacterium]|nr:DUF5655 domain-containing protein [Opitutales bacterium]